MPHDHNFLPRPSPSQVTSSTILVVLITALLFFCVLYLIWQLWDIIQWFLIAVFVAVAITPIFNALTQRGMSRGIAILLVYLGLLLLLAGMVALVLPPLVEQVQTLVARIAALSQAPGGPNRALEEFAARYGLTPFVDTLRGQIEALPDRLVTATTPLVAVVEQVIFSITALFSILLITFFLVVDGERFIVAALRLVAEPGRTRIRRVLDLSARAVNGYITGNLLISLISGVTVYAILALLQMPYAVALALVVAILDLIPLVGATLAAVLVIIVGFIVAPINGVVLLVFFVVYQQVENNVVSPLVYGRSVHLHPLVVFLALLIGGKLLGILGALLAIPVAEVLRILIVEWIASRSLAPEPGSDARQDKESAA